MNTWIWCVALNTSLWSRALLWYLADTDQRWCTLGNLRCLWGGACPDQRYAGRLAQFQASVHPFIFTPGDNDWTDCHGSGYDPIDRLNLERRLFFSDGFTLGQQRLPLVRQSDDPAYALY